MTSVTTVAVNKDIRNLAAKKAKQDQISVSAVVRILLKDYAEGRIKIGSHVESIQEIPVDEESQGLMDEVVDVWMSRK